MSRKPAFHDDGKRLSGERTDHLIAELVSRGYTVLAEGAYDRLLLEIENLRFESRNESEDYDTSIGL